MPDYILDYIESQGPSEPDSNFSGMVWINTNPEDHKSERSEPKMLASRIKKQYREIFREKFWSHTRRWIVIALIGSLLVGSLSFMLNNRFSFGSIGIWNSIFGSALLGFGKLKAPSDVWRIVTTRITSMDTANTAGQITAQVDSTLTGLYGFFFLIIGFFIQLASVLVA